jgi:excisionase family DNA binding protein
MVTKMPLNNMLTIREVSALLHIHPNTLRRWCDLGRIRAYRITTRGDRRFKQEDIAYFLEKLVTTLYDGAKPTVIAVKRKGALQGTKLRPKAMSESL